MITPKPENKATSETTDRDNGDHRPVAADDSPPAAEQAAGEREHGGPTGPEPTRYGDWERKGRCIDF